MATRRKEKSSMSVSEAGRKGGRRASELIEKGRQKDNK